MSVQHLSWNSHTRHLAPAVCHLSAGVQVVQQQGGGEKATAIAVDRAAPTQLQTQGGRLKLKEERGVWSVSMFFVVIVFAVNSVFGWNENIFLC